MKSATVAIVGRPSCGKSTLLNTLCGHKVSIIAEHPQTTRNVIRGIVTEERGQLILLDTPGLHASDRKLNTYLTSAATQSLLEVDLILYLIDSTRAPGEEEGRIVERLKGSQAPILVALTKIDLESRAKETIRSFVAANLPGATLCEISSIDGRGVEELRAILFERAPEGEALYTADFYTDQPPEFRASEIIREQAIKRVREEVPHALYVEIEDMETREGPLEPAATGALAPEGEPLTGDPGPETASPSDRAEPALWIRASIVVERESQKGILIGKSGSMIREIRIASQRELAALFPYRISLDLRVKVQPKWRKDDRVLRRLIR